MYTLFLLLTCSLLTFSASIPNQDYQVNCKLPRFDWEHPSAVAGNCRNLFHGYVSSLPEGPIRWSLDQTQADPSGHLPIFRAQNDGRSWCQLYLVRGTGTSDTFTRDLLREVGDRVLKICLGNDERGEANIGINGAVTLRFITKVHDESSDKEDVVPIEVD